MIKLDAICWDIPPPLLHRIQAVEIARHSEHIELNKVGSQNDLAHFTNGDLGDACIFISQAQHHINVPQSLTDRYKYKISIQPEPCYSRLKYAGNCSDLHDVFLENYKPDLVGYSCAVDVGKSPADCFFWTNMVDHYGLDVDTPRLDKMIYCGSLRNAWGGHKKPTIDRIIKTVGREKVDVYNNIAYSEVARLVSTYNFQLQLPCGYYFHNLRSLQSWFAGTIPIIIHATEEDDEFTTYYKYFPIKDMENCVVVNILTDPNAYEKIRQVVNDQGLISQMLDNISKMDLSIFSSYKVSKKIESKILEAMA